METLRLFPEADLAVAERGVSWEAALQADAEEVFDATVELEVRLRWETSENDICLLSSLS